MTPRSPFRSTRRPLAFPALGLIAALTSCAAGSSGVPNSPTPQGLEQQETAFAAVLVGIDETDAFPRKAIKTFREESCLDPALENPARETKWLLSASFVSEAGHLDQLIAAVAGALPAPVSKEVLEGNTTRLTTGSGLVVDVSRRESSLAVSAVGRCTRNPEDHVMLKNRLDQGPDGSAPVRFSDES